MAQQESSVDIAALRAERERLSLMSDNWQNLSTEEKIDLSDKVFQVERQISNFEYAQRTFDERVDWWTFQTRHHMRMQAEAGLDQLALFDRKWHVEATQKEPQILDILRLVCERYDIPFKFVIRLLEHELWSDGWRLIRDEVPKTDYV